MNARVRTIALSLLWLCAAATVRAGDAASDAARLRARLSPELAGRVLALIDPAREAGLPTDALVGRALEGASRRAADADIVAEVRRLAGGLASARTALGAGARPVEIEAGAAALLAGLPADSLARLRGSRPSGSLAVSLVVLCDLVARGVPVDSASSAVIRAVRAGAPDASLLRLRERVHDQIQRGSTPTDATRRSLLLLLRSSPEPAAPRRSR